MTGLEIPFIASSSGQRRVLKRAVQGVQAGPVRTSTATAVSAVTFVKNAMGPAGRRGKTHGTATQAGGMSLLQVQAAATVGAYCCAPSLRRPVRPRRQCLVCSVPG